MDSRLLLNRYKRLNDPGSDLLESDDSMIPMKRPEDPDVINDQSVSNLLGLPLNSHPEEEEITPNIPRQEVIQPKPTPKSFLPGIKAELEQEKQVTEDAKEAKAEIKSPISELMSKISKLDEKNRDVISESRKLSSIQTGLSAIMDGINKYAAAKAGGSLTVIKPEKENIFSKAAERTLLEGKEDVALNELDRKKLTDGITLGKELEYADPTSSTSKAYVELIKRRLGEKGMNVEGLDLDNLSANDAVKLSQTISQMGFKGEDKDSSSDDWYKQQRLDLSREKYEDEKNKLPRSVNDLIAENQSTLDSFQEIWSEAPFAANPYAQGANDWFEKINKNDEAKTAFKAKVRAAFTKYKLSATGTAAGVKEMEDLEETFINTKDFSPTLMAKLQVFYKNILNHTKNRLRLEGKQRGDPEMFMDEINPYYESDVFKHETGAKTSGEKFSTKAEPKSEVKIESKAKNNQPVYPTPKQNIDPASIIAPDEEVVFKDGKYFVKKKGKQ